MSAATASRRMLADLIFWTADCCARISIAVEWLARQAERLARRVER